METREGESVGKQGKQIPKRRETAHNPGFPRYTRKMKGFTMVLQEEHMDVRIVKTGQFGDLRVEPQHVFKFADGLFGFDDLHEYVLIADDNSAPLRWLISLEQPEIGFPVISPSFIDASYSAGRDYTDTDRFATLVIVTLAQSGMTVNMKAPVVLDCNDQTGKQLILSSDKYLPNQPLGKQTKA